ncbi:MAG TPA: hypothetical protein EYG65_14695 [Rhodospirillales bacterium]|nr:hypothetical protein [Rhodospirillales bacterium]
MAGSNRRIWWKCDKGPNHEWGAVLRSRTSEGRGCPYCHVLPRSKIELQLAYEIDNSNPKGGVSASATTPSSEASMVSSCMVPMDLGFQWRRKKS